MLIILLLVSLLSISICVIFILIFLAEFVAKFTTDAPFVPVPHEIEEDIIENLGLQSKSVLYDLGCGDGKILTKAVQKHPDIKAIGVERAILPYILARIKTRKYNNIKIKREDIFKTDISSATDIFLYLYPEVINKLLSNIRRQCESGTKILSCDFEFNQIKPIKVVSLNKTNSGRGKKLFVYTL